MNHAAQQSTAKAGRDHSARSATEYQHSDTYGIPARPPNPMPVAVTGIGCRFAGVHGPQALWAALREGRDLVSDTPPERFDTSAYRGRESLTGDPLLATEAGGFLDDVESFDANFFRISPREATRLDPHQRLFLETAWEAVEDAGIPLERLRGSRTGVYSAQLSIHYWQELRRAGICDLHTLVGAQIPGNMAGRLANILDLRGPTASIDSACSSTLLAVHMACQAIRAGDLDAAIVGGVNILEQAADTVALSSGSLIAPSGRCRFGDAAADGFVRSEGAAAVVLKPLARALADGDRVYGVIRGSAASNDGASQGQYLTPSVSGRGDMLRSAYAAAGMDPREVDYVEAHGAGTPTGDLAELAAMREVLGGLRTGQDRLLIGSVKTNIGHTETVSGLAGLIKTALCLQHGEIPATLHVRQPTPEFDWADSGLRLARERTPWPQTDHPRTAGVSSFGISGSNVHVIMTAPPEARPAPAADPAPAARILPVSARCPEALAGLAGAYAQRLYADDGGSGLTDLCYSAAVRRSHHGLRAVAVGADAGSMAAKLHALQQSARHAPKAFDDPLIVYVFPGLGAQWTGMARDLLAQCPAFAAALERYDAAIRAEAGWSVIELLQSDDPLTDVGLAQPAVWAFECALAEVWAGWGLAPDLAVGHSMGEIAAATFSGALSLADGTAVTCRRSALMRRAAGRGAMTAVQLPAAQARELAAQQGGYVCVAVHNGPNTSVLAGTAAALERIERELTARQVFWRRVNADVAAHCAAMDPLLDDLRTLLDGIAPADGRIPLQSTVHGRRGQGAEFDVEYWVDNLREPVLFEDAVRRVLAEADRPVLFVELTPHPLLAHAVQDSIDESGARAAVISTLRRTTPGLLGLLEALGQAYTHGANPDWAAVTGVGTFAPPPRYPWQRRRFRAADAAPNLPADLLPLAGGLSARPGPAPAGARGDSGVEQVEHIAAMVGAGAADVRTGLRAALAEVLALDPAELRSTIPVTDYGLDSVLAMDLRRRVQRRFGMVVPVKILLQGGTLDEAAAQAVPVAAV
ncbi:MAG TPA: type I polyketide synthase [Actinocrinis sp.]|nr:type I polyketide synthase [Actinocrinis sp.]